MEIALLILIVIILALLLFLVRSSDKVSDKFDHFTDRMDQRLIAQQERNTQFEKDSFNNLLSFQDKLNHGLDTQYLKLQEQIEFKLDRIDQKVNNSLEEGFEKTNETFTKVIERLSKIDEAQKKIDSLSIEIVSLQDVLTDKKTRGVFGEVQLNQVLSAVFGDKNDAIYRTQYTFAGVRADAVLFAPEPLGTIIIDSKFPLENYRKMIDKKFNEYERSISSKQFVLDCKKHVDDIANKYIVQDVTSNQAMMFVPAEAVFATINAYHPEVIDYAHSRNVWLVSPTTLMSTLTIIQSILMNVEREKYASIIHQQLKYLGTEFERYALRWDKLKTHIETVNKDVNDIHITSTKISKKFKNIQENEFEEIDHDF